MSKKLISLVVSICFVGVALPGATRQVQAEAPWICIRPPPLSTNTSFRRRLQRSGWLAALLPHLFRTERRSSVLTQDGYVTAVKGGNGFVCLVERAWAKSTDDPEFWNPKVSAPHCLNASAAKTYLPIVLLKTKLVLAGKSKMEIAQTLKAAMDEKELPTLDPNAMCYMMSKQQYLSDNDVHWHPHMMWYVPGDSAKSGGPICRACQ